MLLTEATFVSVDLETTGLDVRHDDIIAVALVPMEGLKIRVRYAYYTLVKPRTYRLKTMKVHGIAQDALQHAPAFEEIAEELIDRCDGFLLGHCVHIDYQFLRRAFKEVGLSFKRELVDIAEVEKWIGQKTSHRPSCDELSLDALISRYGLREHYRHHALADAFFAAQIFQIQMTRHGVLHLEQLLDQIKNLKVCDTPFLV
ncbi:3'-5' exonuclease [Desulfosoma caldarium]|uniref:DNA polymerase-3 subunit epsilon n=1 Tax=Desulfosoma caldarium TaxID=610254 RepID=A0A3N1UIF3_9BACT|nr:3'-5' exonuclease [Desulfosoma caldarium]ROQ89558.1 DNA polymerase-3 subunit epsilon [Desulfosoma caldarium]